MPEVVNVDLCGQASLRERLGPGLREVAPAELAALHTDEDEPVRPRCRVPVHVRPQLGDDQLRKRDLPGADSGLGRALDKLPELVDGPSACCRTLQAGLAPGSAASRARRDFPPIEFVTDTKPVIVEGMQDRLTRAIDNLLRNAALHSETHHPVEVTVDAEGVTIRDHGKGIAQSDLPHIFERFYRSADSRSRPGTGLGFAIVQQVAEQHAATAAVTNAVDGGAVFTIRFNQIEPVDEA